MKALLKRHSQHSNPQNPARTVEPLPARAQSPDASMETAGAPACAQIDSDARPSVSDMESEAAPAPYVCIGSTRARCCTLSHTNTIRADAPAGVESDSKASGAGPVPPASYCCPISMEIMADPVIIATGHTYDRACIERWLQSGNKTCPVTGMRLRHHELTPNFALRTAIQVGWLLLVRIVSIAACIMKHRNGRLSTM